MLHQRGRATIEAADLAIVLSHFDLGVIESITELPRGSRRSAKVGIVAQRGKYLLKQRSVVRVPQNRMVFSHAVQAHLRASGFPMPSLIAPRVGSEYCVRQGDHVFELFEFVGGHPFDRSQPAARDGGATLARFHRLTQSCAPSIGVLAPSGDYHDAPGVRAGLCQIESMLCSHDSVGGQAGELAELVQILLNRYDHAADAVNRGGFSALSNIITHSDWHPGNLLFRDQAVLAVVDFDSMRSSKAVTDVATGALHFSILAADDPESWPEGLDEHRFQAFLEGYQSNKPLCEPETVLIPNLMIESLIAECVPPITETGSVGRWSGFRVLQMILRKLKWLEVHGVLLVRKFTS